jgi:heme A synthase
MYSQNSHLNNQLKVWLLSLIALIILIILVGGLTRLTDSGLSITTWELFVGFIPPLTNDKWIDYFELYKTIPEFSEQNYNMTLNEFKIIFWWEWGHRQLGRLIGLSVLLPLIFFSIKYGLRILKNYGLIFVSGMDAGKVYNTWPLMGSSYFPDDSQFIEFLNVNVFDNPSIVQFIHRNLAYLILGIYIYILYFVIKDCNVVFRKPIFIIGFSLSLQVVLGILTLLSGVKIVYASLHQINSILIILSTLYFLYLSNYRKVN